MDLNLSDEQRLLRESAERFIAESYAPAGRGSERPHGFDPGMWQRFAGLGWLALPIAGQFGGIGSGAVEIMIVMEALGRGLVTEPYRSTVVLGAGLVGAHAAPAQQAAILPRIASGDLVLALAHDEGRAHALDHVATEAVRDGTGWRITGTKPVVPDAPVADLLLVTARLPASDGDLGRIGVFAVPCDTAGISCREFARLGGGSGASVELAAAHLEEDALLGSTGDAGPALEAAIDRAPAALAAEAVGMMQALLEKTAAYTRTREQFGRPLAANQVVCHKLADMAIACEEARSMALLAALRCQDIGPVRGRAVSGAKAKVAAAARFVAEQAVQLHGGMGVTEELDIGSYFKRVLAFETLFGGREHHLRRHAALRAAPT